MAPGLARLRLDNSPEAFFVRDAEALARYERFEFDFGRDRAARLVLGGEGLWSAAGLAWLASLEEEVAALAGVIATAGPYRRHGWRYPNWPPADPAALRAEMLADGLDRGAGWVSADGRRVTVLVAFYKLEPEAQRRALAEIETLLAAAPPGVEAEVVGLPVVSRALDRALLGWAGRFLPLLLLAAAALLFAAFRRPADVAAPLVLVGVCLTVLLGAMGWWGARLDMVIIVLVPLVFVITLATAVHMLACFRQLRRGGLEPAAASAETRRRKGWPVLWTGVTTGVGFGSLAVSPVPPVQALGVWSALGMAFMTLAALTFYPALLALSRGPADTPGAGALALGARRWGRSLAAWSARRRWGVVAAFAAAALLALAALPRLRLEGGALSYLPPGHAVRAAVEELEGHGIAMVAAELVLRRGTGPPLDGPEMLARQAELSRRLRHLEGGAPVMGTVSAGDLVAAGARHRPAGEDSSAATRDFLRSRPELGPLLGFLVTPAGDAARVSLLVPMRGFQELGPLFDRALAEARRAFPAPEVASVELTGRYPLVLAAQRTLLRTMVLSLGLTLLCVVAIFRGLLGTVALTLRAVAPNLWPVVLVLGAMGWLKVPVDSSTVMIAAAVLGLAVDDTLHTLGQLRRLDVETPSAEAAVATLEELAGPHTATSWILAAGFGVCVFTPFVPVARFGALAAFGVLMALVADLSLVPALLAGARREERARLGRA